MSDIDRIEHDVEHDAEHDVEHDAEHDAACCVNAGCGNRFDPDCEGFNGECDHCAAVAADHFTGAHRGLAIECLLCWADEPGEADRSLAVAA